MLYTGSTETSKCTSRFGVQDMVGNLAEWSSDQITCSTDNSCTGTSSTFDIGAGGAFNFDSDPGPVAVTTTNNLDRWFFSDTTYNGMSATDFIVPLGLPAITKATTGLTSLVIGTDISTAAFHSDMISIDAYTTNANSDVAGLVYGGSYTYGDCETSYSIQLCGGGGTDCTGTSSPNGSVTGVQGAFYWDSSNEICYKNTDGATSWATYSTGSERAGRYTLEAHEVTTSRKDIGLRCVIEVANPYP
jgi:hypothetical protein